jgi:ribonuclease HI
MKSKVFIYTDGSADNRRKVGGWGAILIYGTVTKEIHGTVKETTSNRMELTAPIKALKKMKKFDVPIVIHSDSQYVIRGMNEWIERWQRNNWISSTRKEVVNKDLWIKLLKISKKFTSIEWVWVRGHAGDEYQEVAHTLAEKGYRKHNC